MINIAICHEDEAKRRLLCEKLRDYCTTRRLNAKLFSVRSIEQFAEKCVMEQCDFDAILMQPQPVDQSIRIMHRSRSEAEYVLLDASASEVKQLLRFKPVGWVETEALNEADFRRSVDACLYYVSKRKNDSITLTMRNEIVRVPLNQLLYLESGQRKVCLHMQDPKEDQTVPAKLEQVLSHLPGTQFVRCHQSYAVNVDHVVSLNRETHSLNLDRGDVVDISRRYYPEIRKLVFGLGRENSQKHSESC